MMWPGGRLTAARCIQLRVSATTPYPAADPATYSVTCLCVASLSIISCKVGLSPKDDICPAELLEQNCSVTAFFALAMHTDAHCSRLCSSGGLENHALKASFRHHKDVRHTFVMSCSRTFLGSVEKHSCLFYGLPQKVLSMMEQICARL